MQMISSQRSASGDVADDLSHIWANGYSIPELWGFTKPFSSSEPSSDKTHILLWGILSIVEYQVDKGAGHKYLRDRLWNRDWIAIGFFEPKTLDSKLEILPPIENAKFGRQFSAVGDGVFNFTDVRIVSRSLFQNVELVTGT